MANSELNDAEKWKAILHLGWKGLCPRCRQASMYRKWLKLRDHCPSCGLDYSFAAPDDGPAFFSQCVVAFPLTLVIVLLQVSLNPPVWVHFVTTGPVIVGGCVWALQPIKGWLVASQYLNNAQEAGTENLWAKLNASSGNEARDGDRS